MIKKFLSLFFILYLIVSISSIIYATEENIMNLSDETVDTTIYGSTENLEETPESEESESLPLISGDYDVSTSDELSISNIINIILIVVGVVLILLAIAILTKLR